MAKNFRNIPKSIEIKLKSIKTNEIIVASIIRISKDDIRSNKYRKMGIFYVGPDLILESFTPLPSVGKSSRINKFGKIIVRKDLPMISKTYSIESPNFGDWSKGSHEVSWERKIYIREKIKPYNTEIFVQKINEDENDLVIGFIAGGPIKKTNDQDLLHGLNLLQENFGLSDVFPTDEVLKEKIAYSRLKWEVLPSGWWSDKNQISKLISRLGSKAGQLFLERLKGIEELKPIQAYVGESYLGNRLYYVFVFQDVVIAECPMFGNALYYLEAENKENWKEIFSKSKKEALFLGAKRLPHIGSWEVKLKGLLNL